MASYCPSVNNIAFRRAQQRVLPQFVSSRSNAPKVRIFAPPKAKGGLGSFDYQLGWPYIALGLETVCVVLHQRAPLAVVAVLLVLFQSPADNQFLKAVAGSGIFARYKDAKFFCGVLTAWTFISFLVVSYLMAKT